ncbi:MAG: hypothetical protein U1D55_15970 [Phycisphaerae bacterium]
MRRTVSIVARFVAAGLLASCGCSPEFIANQTQQRTGNINVVFINNTTARAIFSFGTYDALDLDPPGPATLQQSRLGAFNSSAPVQIPCRRNMAVGTKDFIDRVIAVKGDETANFDAEAFDTVVRFSLAPIGSDAEGLPTAGTSAGRGVRLGVDYTCEDRLIFTFEQDATAPGGFRIDFAVIQDNVQP